MTTIDSRFDSTARARVIAEHLLAMRTGEPPAKVVPEPSEIDYRRLQHQTRWFDGVLRLYRAAARAIADEVAVPGPIDAPAKATDDADRLVDIVHRAYRVLLEHPVAAKIAFTALAEQGRAFASTPEGAALRARLIGSPRLRRASIAWRTITRGMLDEQDPGELPSTYLDNLLCAIDRTDLEQLLCKVPPREGTR